MLGGGEGCYPPSSYGVGPFSYITGREGHRCRNRDVMPQQTHIIWLTDTEISALDLLTQTHGVPSSKGATCAAMAGGDVENVTEGWEGGGVGTRPWWLALLACGGAYWPLALEPSAMTSRHPYYCGHPHCCWHPPA